MLFLCFFVVTVNDDMAVRLMHTYKRHNNADIAVYGVDKVGNIAYIVCGNLKVQNNVDKSVEQLKRCVFRKTKHSQQSDQHAQKRTGIFNDYVGRAEQRKYDVEQYP